MQLPLHEFIQRINFSIVNKMSKTISLGTGNSFFGLSIVFLGSFFVFYLTIEQKRLDFGV